MSRTWSAEMLCRPRSFLELLCWIQILLFDPTGRLCLNESEGAREKVRKVEERLGSFSDRLTLSILLFCIRNEPISSLRLAPDNVMKPGLKTYFPDQQTKAFRFPRSLTNC